MRKIPLIKPYITKAVKDKVCEVLDSGYLTEGAQTKALERSFRDFVGCRYSLAVTSCTVGLELALRAVGIGPGDEVIVPDYTYPATADAVAIVGGDIVVVDVDPDTMLIDYDELEKAVTSKTKAVIPVSLFGNPVDHHRLNKIKKKFGLIIVEDAACAIGAEYCGTRVGSLADISVFSLHPRKFITSGEGGMICTGNPKWCDWMNSYKHFGIGINKDRLLTSFDRIGTNYKLSDVLSAIALVQMEQIENLLARRRELAANYIKLLEGQRQIRLPKTTPGGKHSFQSFCIFIHSRDEAMKSLREEGIEVQIGTYCLHMQKAFSENPNCRLHSELRGSKFAYENSLVLPLYHDMSKSDQEYVVNRLINILKTK
jgi:dTDP-4-amino-4,6-dideoxygalactose transaminase